MRLLLAVYAASGAAALAYEVLWARSLALLFGGSAPAVGAVLAAVLGANAAGALAARRPARSPSRTYAALQLAVGACALAWPWTFGAVERVYALAAPASGPGLRLFQLAAAFAAVGLPAACLGAGLPVLSAFFDRDSAGAGLLWGLGIAGGAAGALGAGLLLLPALGLALSLRAAGLASLALGALSLRLRLAAPFAPLPTGAALTRERGTSGDAALLGLAAPAAFAAGLATLALETAWTRVLTMILGGSTAGFAFILAAFLLGLGYGSVWTTRRPVLPQRLVTGLAFLFGASAAAAWLSVWIAPRLPVMYLVLFRLAESGTALHAARLALAVLAVGPSSFFLGALLPQCLWLLANRRAASPRGVGALTALHGAGCVAGAALTAFVVLPAWGLERTILACAFFLAASGAVLLASNARSAAGALRASATCAVLAAVAGAAAPAWRPATLASGIYMTAPRLLESLSKPESGRLSAKRTLLYKDGVLATVHVAERLGLSPGPQRSLSIDGKVEASTEKDMPTQALTAHLPALLAQPRPKAFLVGLASGVTAGELLRHPLSALTVAEIEPAVVPASRLFDRWNGRPLEDARTVLEIDDARQLLRRSAAAYDLIVSQPSNPWLTGPARLFTLEFFLLARGRLAPGGVYAQWLQTYSLETGNVRTVVRTFLEAFPHAALFEPSPGDLVLVGSREPLRLERTSLERAFEEAGESLKQRGFETPGSLLSLWRMGTESMRRFAGPGPLNTDDNGRLEYGASEDLLKDTVAENRRALLDASDDPLDQWTGWTAEDALDLARAELAQGRPREAERAARRSLAAAPSAEGRRLLARSLSAQGRPGAEGLLENGLRLGPAEPGLLEDAARLRLEAQDARGAYALLTRPAARLSPESRWLKARALWALGRCREAVPEFRKGAAGPEDEASASLHAAGCGLDEAAAGAAWVRLRDRWAWLTPEEADARKKDFFDRSGFAGDDRTRLEAELEERAFRPLIDLRKALGTAALGRFRGAADQLQGLMGKGGELGLLAQYYRGLCLAELGENKDARRLLSDFAARASLLRPEDFRPVRAREELDRLSP